MCFVDRNQLAVTRVELDAVSGKGVGSPQHGILGASRGADFHDAAPDVAPARDTLFRVIEGEATIGETRAIEGLEASADVRLGSREVGINLAVVVVLK